MKIFFAKKFGETKIMYYICHMNVIYYFVADAEKLMSRKNLLKAIIMKKKGLILAAFLFVVLSVFAKWVPVHTSCGKDAMLNTAFYENEENSIEQMAEDAMAYEELYCGK